MKISIKHSLVAFIQTAIKDYSIDFLNQYKDSIEVTEENKKKLERIGASIEKVELLGTMPVDQLTFENKVIKLVSVKDETTVEFNPEFIEDTVSTVFTGLKTFTPLSIKAAPIVMELKKVSDTFNDSLDALEARWKTKQPKRKTNTKAKNVSVFEYKGWAFKRISTLKPTPIDYNGEVIAMHDYVVTYKGEGEIDVYHFNLIKFINDPSYFNERYPASCNAAIRVMLEVVYGID